jgi:hypothetical protein
MDGYPTFAICIGLPLVTLGLILFALSIILKKPTTESRKIGFLLAAALVLSVGIVAFAVQWYLTNAEYESMRHVNLSFDATLTMNGTGSVRISLPIPTAEALYSRLQINPSSSTSSINSTGGEPRLDIVMSEDTMIHGSLYGLWSEVPHEMTKTTLSSTHCWPENCTSEIHLEVLSGIVTGVHVVVDADWDSSCHGYMWDLECDAIIGSHEYPGEWLEYMC